MQQIRRARWMVGVLVVVMALTASPVPAAASSFESVRHPGRKLSRGLANAVAGVIEVPLAVSAIHREEGPVAALSWGLFLGLSAAIARTAIGAVEVATFLFPLPRVGYGPILQPEFLLHPDQGRSFTERSPASRF